MNNYLDYARKLSRRSYVEIIFGLYNKIANSKVENIESYYKQSFSVLNINNFKKTNIEYVSCEPGRTYPNENVRFINSDDSSKNTNQYRGYWSSEMSDNEGYFSNNPKITYYFSDLIDFTNLTLYFQEVVEQFVIRYYNNNDLIYTGSISGNNNLVVETNFENQKQFNILEIEFIKTYIPYRYIKYNNLDFGIVKTFSKDQLIDLDINNELDLYSDELVSNTATFIIKNPNKQYSLYEEDDSLNFLQEKQEIQIYHYLKVGNEFIQKPLGTYLVKEFNSNSLNIEFVCYDDIYFMNDIYYGSKFYNNENLVNILRDLFEYFNYVNYDLSDIENENILLTGYIPNVTFREALRLIVEASKCCVFKNKLGLTKIVYFGNVNDESILSLANYEIFNDNPVKNLYNNVVDIISHVYNEYKNEIVYNAQLEPGIYNILYNNYPCINAEIVDGDGIILKQFATGCQIEVNSSSKIIIKADVYNINKTRYRINKDVNATYDEYAIREIDNPLITTQYQEIAMWKLNKNSLTKNLEIMNIPTLELGDTITYEYNKGKTIDIKLTNLNYTNSIRMYIKGE